MAQTVLRFAQSVTLRQSTQAIINHKPQFTYLDSTIKATIHPADMEKLQIEGIDKNIKYIDIFTTTEVKINDLIVYKGSTYKVIKSDNYSEYGYFELVGAEDKR